MKFKWVLLAAYCILAIPIPADSKSPDRKAMMYANFAIGFGSPGAYQASLAYLFKQHHELSIGFQYYSRKRSDIPSDYEAQQMSSFGAVNYVPRQSFNAAAITYGYVMLPRKRADLLRYVARAGLLLGHLSTPYNYKLTAPTSTPLMYTSNYTHEQREQQTAAILLNTTLDYTPRQWFGISFGLYATLANDFGGGGATLGFLLGNVRKERHL